MKTRYLFLSLTLIVGIFTLTGCQNKLDDLPDNPVVFKTGELNEDSGYRTIEHNGKVYIMYGNIKSKGLFRDVSYAYGDCLGYVEDDKSDRIYALDNHSTDEWLIEYNVDGMMEQPVVLREISSKGSNSIPDNVESLDYEYWK